MNNVTLPPFNASPSNTPTANAAAFEAAIAAGPAYVPSGTYQCSQITLSTLPVLTGDGPSSIILSTSPGPAILVNIGSAFTGMILRDFSVQPASPGAGTYGLHFATGPGGFLNQFEISNVNVGRFGQQGICLDNSAANADGIFDGLIRRGNIVNGILGLLIGDQLVFDGIVIEGSGIAIQLSQVPGANTCVIQKCTLVTTGGGIYLTSNNQTHIIHNEMEQPAYLSDYTGTLGAMCVLQDCYGCKVMLNEINALAGSPGPSGKPIVGAAYDVLASGGQSNLVDYNGLGPCASGTDVSASPGNAIGPNNIPSGPTAAAVKLGGYNPATGAWTLNTLTGPITFQYGFGGTYPVVGDWFGIGKLCPGLYYPATGTWYLGHNPNAGDGVPLIFQFGFAGTLPVVGDWIGDGKTRVGVYDPATGTWYLNQNVNAPGAPLVVQFNGGPLPVIQ